MGTIIMPVGDLGQGVTMSSVLAFLNSNINPFDFEYNPLENDSLDIRTGNEEGYFKVIYENIRQVI